MWTDILNLVGGLRRVIRLFRSLFLLSMLHEDRFVLVVFDALLAGGVLLIMIEGNCFSFVKIRVSC